MYYIGHMGYFGGVTMIIFLGLVIWLVIWLINQNKNRNEFKETPLHIIKRRYAEGEITKKQFEDMKKEIRK
jgi:putative membrane protein